MLSVVPCQMKGPLYLMPFCTKSVFLFHLLRQANIEPAGFWDNAPDLNGKEYRNCPIANPSQMAGCGTPFTVALCEPKYQEAFFHQMETVEGALVLEASELPLAHCTAAQLSAAAAEVDVESFCVLVPKQANFARRWFPVYGKYLSFTDFALQLKERARQPYRFRPEESKGVSLERTPRVVICVNVTKSPPAAWLTECLNSLRHQSFSDFLLQVVLPQTCQETYETVVSTVFLGKSTEYHILNEPLDNYSLLRHKSLFAAKNTKATLFVVDGADLLAPNALAHCLETLQKAPAARLATANEDRLYKGEFISSYKKQEYLAWPGIDTKTILRQFIVLPPGSFEILDTIVPDDICIVNKVLYHYRVASEGHDNKIKPIAFYLPQFHTFPENDRWWGKGFTEWTNVRQAKPLYPGHYQPRVPGALGYYDLANDPDIQHRQIELAKKYGIHGFCYYYYWFDGKRLMEKPLDRLLANKTLDFPFCICWANENWTRRWDGQERDILIEQPHTTEGYCRFIYDIIPLLKDARYIKISGAPLLLVYLKILMPEPERVFAYWRDACAKSGVPQIHIACVESCGQVAPPLEGCDSTIEFPPHTFPKNEITDEACGLETSFAGRIFDYAEYTSRCMNAVVRPALYFRGAMTGWDNTARRISSPQIFNSATPALYKRWLVALADHTVHLPPEHRYLFINAWNEWGEGTYLEPDELYGEAWLKATKEALSVNF